MAITNPILENSTDYSEKTYNTPLDQNFARIQEGGNKLIENLAENKIRSVQDSFQADLQAEELQFRDELGKQLDASNVPDEDILKNIPGVTETDLQSTSPQVRTLMALDAKDRQGVKQGFLDANDYTIRAEARLRQYLVRYPHLGDELLNVARTSGGFSLIPADLQATFEDIKAIQTAQGKEDSEIKRLKQVSKEYKVDQTLYTTNPTKYWETTLAFANAEESLAKADQQVRARQATGTLASFDIKGALAKAVPGYSAQAWANDIQPTILSSLGIANISAYDGTTYDPTTLDNIKQELENKKAKFLGDSFAKYGGSGDVSTDTIKGAVQPVLDMYDAAIARLGSKTFAADMNDYVSTLTKGAILKMPDGIALQVSTDLVRGLDQTFTSALVRNEVSTRIAAGLASLFNGTSLPGKAPNFDANGRPLAFAPTNPLIDLEHDPAITPQDVQQGVMGFINQVSTKLDELATNKDPIYHNTLNDAAVSALRMLADYYNDDAIKATKGVAPQNIADAMVALGAKDTFKEAFQVADPSLQQALVGTFSKATEAEWRQVLQGEVNQDLAQVLAFDTKGTLTATVPNVPYFGQPQPTTIQPKVTETLAKAQPIVLTVNPTSGQVYFVVDNVVENAVQTSEFDVQDKNRISKALSNAANQLTTKYGPRLTNLVRMAAHTTPNFDALQNPYGASFGVLSQNILASGNVNIGIDVEAIKGASQ